MEQTLMKQEQKKQAFSSFFEDCFSTRNIIENSIRNWKILVFFTLFGAVTAFALTQYVIRPIYSAQATVFAMNTEGRNDNRIYSNEVLVGQHLSYDYQQFMVREAMYSVRSCTVPAASRRSHISTGECI